MIALSSPPLYITIVDYMCTVLLMVVADMCKRYYLLSVHLGCVIDVLSD